MTPDDLIRRRARQLAAAAAASGDPDGWFETLYAEARDGHAVVPWDDREPNPHLVRWAATAASRGVAGPGSMHLLSAVANCPAVACLVDHPATFPYVWSGNEASSTPRIPRYGPDPLIFMIAKTSAPFSGVKPFAIMGKPLRPRCLWCLWCASAPWYDSR